MAADPMAAEEDERPDEDYFASYGDPGVHRLMIGDHVRTDAYRRALEAVVQPGTTVLDVGTGTGILALFAARAGAEHVWAVDNSSILYVARRVAEDNDLDDAITFVRGRAEELELPVRVDVLVSEWMGFFALTECMFTSVIAARDRHLRVGGQMVPSILRLYVAPVEDSTLHVECGVGLWERPVYGFDFGELLEHEMRNLISTAVELRPSALLGPPAKLVEIDCGTAQADDFFFSSKVSLTVERSGTLHGIGGWFDVDLGGGVTLSTSPRWPPTHWRQSFFPVRPVALRSGDHIDLEIVARPREFGDRRLPLYFLEAVMRRAGQEIHRCFYCHHGSFE